MLRDDGPIEKDTGYPNRSKKLSVFTGIILISSSFLIYLPVIHHYFVSDDFKVLYRVCRENTIFIKGFFRPLSDITIFLNYQWNGLDPTLFNITNVLIHGINSYLIYLICLYPRLSFSREHNVQFATISAAVFLTYPFHNEAVVWLLGRGASLACLFSLLSILSFFRIKNRNLNIFAVCCFYFISIAAFESTIFFPIIFILLLLLKKESIRYSFFYVCGLTAMLALNLLLRYLISGSIMGSYGKDFFQPQMSTYLMNIAKVSGRLILPPTQNAFLITGIFIGLIAMFVYFLFRYTNKNRNPKISRYLLIITGMLAISCIVPVATGVSTQTSETDRILYFPSVFISMLAGFFIIYVLKNKYYKVIFLMILFSFNFFFLEKNNMNWNKASMVTKSVVATVQSEMLNDKKTGKIFFVNIPTEISGAYSFRNGFPEALKLYNADSTRFIIINLLTRQDQEKITVSKTIENLSIDLQSGVVVKSDSGIRKIYDHGVYQCIVGPADKIYYWDGEFMKSL
jgi:hypothetical protein